MTQMKLTMCAMMALAACSAGAQSGDMTYVKGGTFQMGSPEAEYEREDDETLHTVMVEDFYMGTTEVTQEAYEALMGSNPSEHKGANLPVENVTWYDAVSYCNALSRHEGLTPCYTIQGKTVLWNQAADGYRLPTEAEWEYAARGGSALPFSFGDYVHDSDANCYNAYGYNNNATGHWVNGYLQHTVAVSSYAANSFGLKNMHGNVAEWTWDWYEPYDAEEPSEQGWFKVVRGGGWNDFPKHIRSAYRSAFPPDVPLYATGIRLVRSASRTEQTVRSDNAPMPSRVTGRVLIAYFSQTGNTEGLANIIHELSGYDIFRIERATPYSATYNSQGLYAEALTEQREKAAPDLKNFPDDIDRYDIILLGYCNWWASIPAPVRTFLMKADLKGKTIVPFCSMGGGRFGQTISAIAKLAPQSTILKGLDVEYSSYDRTEIRSWLNDIAQYQSQQTGISNIQSATPKSDSVYSLDGKKIPAGGSTRYWMHPGTYIVNGEKRVIK